jgi:hypothetical protein
VIDSIARCRQRSSPISQVVACDRKVGQSNAHRLLVAEGREQLITFLRQSLGSTIIPAADSDDTQVQHLSRDAVLIAKRLVHSPRLEMKLGRALSGERMLR